MTAALQSPAAERNKQPILEVLQRLLPERGRALEIASGSGQHVAYFATHLPQWHWQASDPRDEARDSIAAWYPQGPPPLRLDVLDADWPLPPAALDAIFCANMLHISPWPTCAALMRGAAHHLSLDGQLLIYGPFIVPDIETAPSNVAFDADLRRRDPSWGLRHLDDVQAAALQAGLRPTVRVAMPANNLLLAFKNNQEPQS